MSLLHLTGWSTVDHPNNCVLSGPLWTTKKALKLEMERKYGY